MRKEGAGAGTWEDFPEDYDLWLRWPEAEVRMEKLASTPSGLE